MKCRCCVAKEINNTYFPWRASVPVPGVWEPFLPWSQVAAIAVTSILLSLGVLGLVLASRAAYHRMRRVGRLSPVPIVDCTKETANWDSASEETRLRASAEISQLLADIDAAIERIQANDPGNDLFMPASYDVVKQQLRDLLLSRARRLAGYDLQARSVFLMTEREIKAFRSQTDQTWQQGVSWILLLARPLSAHARSLFHLPICTRSLPATCAIERAHQELEPHCTRVSWRKQIS